VGDRNGAFMQLGNARIVESVSKVVRCRLRLPSAATTVDTTNGDFVQAAAHAAAAVWDTEAPLARVSWLCAGEFTEVKEHDIGPEVFTISANTLLSKPSRCIYLAMLSAISAPND
jgi:hypothetical protein